jgi:hypothetical protein
MMMMARIFSFRGTELHPDIFAKDGGRRWSVQRVKVALMRQRHKEES